MSLGRLQYCIFSRNQNTGSNPVSWARQTGLLISCLLAVAVAVAAVAAVVAVAVAVAAAVAAVALPVLPVCHFLLLVPFYWVAYLSFITLYAAVVHS